MQILPSTWRLWSEEVYGEVREQTPSNERYVAYIQIEKWLDAGLTPQQVAAKWNSGSATNWENKIGINKHGVAYNVPEYVKKVLAFL